MANPITFPSETDKFGLPLLFSGQAQKEFFINQSFAVIDSALGCQVLGSVDAPPANAGEGDAYRVLENATGEWAGEDGAIATLINGVWQFVAPWTGRTVFDVNADTLLHYNSGWQSAIEPSAPAGGATVDQEARQAILGLIEALRNLGVFANP